MKIAFSKFIFIYLIQKLKQGCKYTQLKAKCNDVNKRYLPKSMNMLYKLAHQLKQLHLIQTERAHVFHSFVYLSLTTEGQLFLKGIGIIEMIYSKERIEAYNILIASFPIPIKIQKKINTFIREKT